MDKHLQYALETIEDATRGMTREELLCHPQGKWCAAEILEPVSYTHLTLPTICSV